VKKRIGKDIGGIGRGLIRGNSVKIALGYGMYDRGLIPGRNREYSLLYSVRIDSGFHPFSNPRGPGFVPDGVNQSGRDTHHLLHLEPRLRMFVTIPQLPHSLHVVVFK
jgi:hypothetical protein